MVDRRRTLLLASACLIVGATLIAGTSASVVPVRTLMITQATGPRPADGASANPVLSADGRTVVFDSVATNLVPRDPNGGVRDVIGIDIREGRSVLISEGGNGPSTQPATSARGLDVAFVSAASNLWEEDSNGVADVFYRAWPRPIRPVSVDPRGRPANGPSSDPDISANGRYVVFVSSATNLVGRDRNGQPDVFRHDLIEGDTTRVSVGPRGREADGPSGAPAISADGRFVSFASQARNLVTGDTNRTGDVFVHDVRSRKTTRVTVSSGGRQQNRSVARPYVQISDLSRNGRYVVFDSEATNLVRRDTNRRADVFLHDRTSGETRLVSASSLSRQGNNDSISPTITPDGRHVAFQSFASNLAPGNGPREDIFVRDLRLGTTSIVNVPARGGRRRSELVRQLLQRPAISDIGTRVAFISTAPGLVPGDVNGVSDVFLRLLAAPRTRLVGRPRAGRRPSVVVTADDPQASTFLCRIDLGSRFRCPRGRIVVPRGLRPGRHELGIRAGGPGLAFDPAGINVPIVVRRR